MGSDESDQEKADRERRAAARSARISVRVQSLASEEEALDGTDSMGRLIQCARLSAAAWGMTGQLWPRLARKDWPVRVRWLGDEA